MKAWAKHKLCLKRLNRVKVALSLKKTSYKEASVTDIIKFMWGKNDYRHD